MKFLVCLGSFLLVLCIGVYFFCAFYIINNAERDEKKPADVIVVLGTKAYINNAYNPCLVARVKHGVDLYQKHYAPKLLFSGGNDKKEKINEAQAMKQIALSLGVPAKDILIESLSNTTYENLLYSKKIFKKQQVKSIIIVTEPFHLPRALLVAKKLGLKAVGSPSTQSKCWSSNKYITFYFLREPLAMVVYKLRNKL